MVKLGVAISPSALRKTVLQMAFDGNTVHIACAFSLIEILSVLYSKHVRVSDHDPEHPDRDYLILSKGHGVMAMYACFKEYGWLPESAFRDYFKDGSLLAGLAEGRVPRLEVTSGSLGHGLPIAAGIAFGLKRQKRFDQKIFCIIGDGEMNEGSVWESLLFAAHHKLNNLIVIVDANGFQAMGETRKVINLESMGDKFKSFGHETQECDGHDVNALDAALRALTVDNHDERPKALVARTVKGKGVSFMESRNEWHYSRLDPDSLARALAELSGQP
jgi:transketolase